MRFQVARIAAKDWPPRVWSNVLIVVVLAVGWLVASCGGTPTQSAERCGSVQFVNGQSREPKVVVVLIDGIPSMEEEGKFYPIPVDHPVTGTPMVTNYCPVSPTGDKRGKVTKEGSGSNYGWPLGLSQGLRRWSEFQVPGPGSTPDTFNVCEEPSVNTNNCLVARLADAGAVILPYSYAGSTLSQQSSGPVFDFHSYSASTSKQDPSISIQKLDDELTSLHNVWKDTHIVVVGHSYGGLIAELWWGCILGHCAVKLNHINPGDVRGVIHVFSLDSPINGLQMASTRCNSSDPVFSGVAVYYGIPVAALFCLLWVGNIHGGTRDRDILILDSTASVPFTAIGTPDDPTYLKVGPFDLDLGGIQNQVIYNYECDPNNNQCIAQPPSYVLGAPNASGCSGAATGHDTPKMCPQVVKFITCSVVAARDNGNQQGCYPSAGSPSTSTSSADLTTVDWNNFTYFSSCYGNTQPFHAKDGKATNNGILFQVYTPTYGDLTGDGQPEAAIPYSCTGADSSGVQIFVYSGNATHPQLLGQLPLPDPSGRATIADVQSVTIKNAVILLTGLGYSGTTGHCCPDLHIESSYRWNGSQFVVVDSNVTRLEAGHVLVVKTDTPILDAQGNPIAPRCHGPQNNTGAIVPAGRSVVVLRDSPVPQPGSKENLYVAYPDPCQPGDDFSHNDTISNGSGAVGYVAFGDLTEVRQVRPHPAFPTTRGTAWHDCWGPTTCADATYPNENDILTSRDPVLYAWWTGSYWDPHWWHVLDMQGQEAAVYGRDWIAVG